MTKQEIQEIMVIVRPAIIAIYGRQSFKLVSYRDRLAYQNKPLKSLFLNVNGNGNNKYRVEFENGRVTSLCIGEFNLK